MLVACFAGGQESRAEYPGGPGWQQRKGHEGGGECQRSRYELGEYPRVRFLRVQINAMVDLLFWAEWGCVDAGNAKKGKASR